MKSLPFGILLMLGVLVFAIDRNSWMLYLNEHAMLMVLGGTVAILFLSTPSKGLKSLIGALSDLFKKDLPAEQHLPELFRLSEGRAPTAPSDNPLIRYAQELTELGVADDVYIALLGQRRAELESHYNEAVQALRNLAKYPPALGMTGTVVGLVTLFSQLDANNKSGIGPALALAMTATFFGLITANAVLTPLADRLQMQQMRKRRLYTNIFQMLALIRRGEDWVLHGTKDHETTRAAA